MKKSINNSMMTSYYHVLPMFTNVRRFREFEKRPNLCKNTFMSSISNFESPSPASSLSRLARLPRRTQRLRFQDVATPRRQHPGDNAPRPARRRSKVLIGQHVAEYQTLLNTHQALRLEPNAPRHDQQARLSTSSNTSSPSPLLFLQQQILWISSRSSESAAATTPHLHQWLLCILCIGSFSTSFPSAAPL